MMTLGEFHRRVTFLKIFADWVSARQCVNGLLRFTANDVEKSCTNGGVDHVAKKFLQFFAALGSFKTRKLVLRGKPNALG